MDRANLSIAGNKIQGEFGFSATQLGLLFWMFTWTYAASQLPVGCLLDRIESKVLYGSTIVICSACTFAMRFASNYVFATVGASFAMLLVCRALTGLAEAPSYLSNTKIVATWIPKNERARATRPTFAIRFSTLKSDPITAMPLAIVTLIGAQLIGEVLRRLLHLPLPGPVVGMFVLALALIGPARSWLAHTPTGPSTLEKSSSTLISNMGLLFVPAGVGIIAELSVLRRAWLPIVAGVLVSTILGLIVTGVVMQRVMRRAERSSSGTPFTR